MPAGRPTRITQEIEDSIVQSVMRGLAISRALQADGFCPSAWTYWASQADEGVEPYKRLVERVRAADARGERELVGIVWMAARDDPKHAQWILERRHKWWLPKDGTPNAAPPMADLPATVADADLEATIRGGK